MTYRNRQCAAGMWGQQPRGVYCCIYNNYVLTHGTLTSSSSAICDSLSHNISESSSLQWSVLPRVARPASGSPTMFDSHKRRLGFRPTEVMVDTRARKNKMMEMNQPTRVVRGKLNLTLPEEHGFSKCRRVRAMVWRLRTVRASLLWSNG